jgi:hypothetical protein
MIFFGLVAFDPFFVRMHKPINFVVTTGYWLHLSNLGFGLTQIILELTPCRFAPLLWLSLHEPFEAMPMLQTVGIIVDSIAV